MINHNPGAVFMKILLTCCAVLLTFFPSANAKIYKFQIFDFEKTDSGPVDFFRHYILTSKCSIEIADSAITPGAFVNFQSPDFKNLSCTVSGNDGPYSFSYSGPGSADQYEGDIFSNSFGYGLLFDSDMQPLRFSGRTDTGAEVTGAIGFYDSNGDDQRFGSSTSYLAVRVDDGFDVPSAVLLEPAVIVTTLRPVGFITKANLLPPDAKAALLNGEFIFEEGSVNNDGDTVNPTLDLRGFLTFDEQLVTPQMRITQAVFEDEEPIKLVDGRTTAILLDRGPLFSDRKVKFSVVDTKNTPSTFDDDVVFPEGSAEVTEDDFETIAESEEKVFFCNEENAYCNLEAGNEYIFRIQLDNGDLFEENVTASVTNIEMLDLFFIALIAPGCDPNSACRFPVGSIRSIAEVQGNKLIQSIFPLRDRGLGMVPDMESDPVGNSVPDDFIRAVEVGEFSDDLRDIGYFIIDQKEALKIDARNLSEMRFKYNSGAAFNRPIGIIYPGYFTSRGKAEETDGFRPAGVKVAFTSQIPRFNSVAHEIGHSFGLPGMTNRNGLKEEYYKNEEGQLISPRSANGFDLYGYFKAINAGSQFRKDNYNFMADGTRGESYWVDENSWMKLATILSEPTSDPWLVNISFAHSKFGAITPLRWRLFEGNEPPRRDGVGYVVLLDDENSEIDRFSYSVNFSIEFEGETTEEVNTDFIDISIPVSEELYTVQIFNSASLLEYSVNVDEKISATLIADLLDICDLNGSEEANYRDIYNEISELTRNGSSGLGLNFSFDDIKKDIFEKNEAGLCEFRGTPYKNAEDFQNRFSIIETRLQRYPLSETIPGDLDLDGDVDRDDLNILMASRNQPASGPDDPKDLDGDGTITGLDARKLTQLCTRARCAVE
jgi:hypothetical protein